MQDQTSMSVAVVIPTHKRPDRLQRALENLAATCDESPPGWAMGVLVVDDDPEGSAADVVASFHGRFDLGCMYVFSGAQNISAARNAGLEAGLAHKLQDGDCFGWLASLDDDVIVSSNWFATCAAALTSGTHNAVTGPLIKDFSRGPDWLTREPFDQIGILRGEDGADAFVCATGNNWVQAQFLRENPNLRFDLSLGRTGGEDMDFFYRAVRAGLRPVFALGASVTEPEPPERCTFRYQLRRAYWLGLLEARIGLRLGLATRFRLLARASRRAANRGSRQLPTDALQRRGPRYGLAVLAQCLGLALGCLGISLRHR